MAQGNTALTKMVAFLLWLSWDFNSHQDIGEYRIIRDHKWWQAAIYMLILICYPGTQATLAFTVEINYFSGHNIYGK